MIRCVFFDFDGVLTTEPYGVFSMTRFLSDKYDIPRETIEDAMNMYLPRRNTEKGHVCPERWALVSNELRLNIPYEVFQEAMGSAPRNDAMFDLVRELRDAGIMTAMITDNFEERINAFDESFQLAEYFDGRIVSTEVGKRKDETDIFDVALSRFGMQADETAFVDNKAKNCVVPESMGIHTYVHDHEVNDVPAFRTFLQSLGILI